jgi:TIR domain
MPVKLFYSYSHKDERHRERLETHLSQIKREGILTEWHDRKIIPGQDWEAILDTNLETSDIIVLLISPEFIASDYCYEKEVRRALEMHDSDEATVIPVIVRPTDWEGSPLGKLQALPKDAKPITTWPNRDKAWLDVTRGIRKAIEMRRLSDRSVVTPHSSTTGAAHTDAPTPQLRNARVVSTQNEAVGEAYRSPQQSRDETDEEFLRRCCRESAQELYSFLTEQGYSRNENHNDPKVVQRDAEALASPQYRENLRPRARNLLKKLKERGLYPPDNLARFQQRSIENTLSLWAVERLADLLSEIGHDW